MKQTIQKALIATTVAVSCLGAATTASANSFNLGGNAGDAHIKMAGFTSNSVTYGTETWFAVGEVTNVLNANNTSQAWFSPNSGSNTGVWVNFFMYGANSLYQPTSASMGSATGCTGSGSGCTGNIYLDLYVNTTGPLNFSTLNASSRTSFNTFNGLTNAPTAELLARFEISTGIMFFSNSTNGAGLTYIGDCIDGNACGANYGTGNGTGVNFDTNGIGGDDLSASFTLAALSSNQLASGLAARGWDLNFNDPGLLVVETPEPGVLLMLGSALLGLAGLSRRQQRS